MTAPGLEESGQVRAVAERVRANVEKVIVGKGAVIDLVLATQNPIELEGTFPLPEAQLDRFLIKLSLGYPSAEEEKAIARRFRSQNPLEELQPVIGVEEMLSMQRLCRQVYVGEVVEDYIVGIVRASRQHSAVELGASPRGTLALYHTAQALAATNGRAYVIPDDVKQLVPAVLGHRLITRAQARVRGRTVGEIIAEMLESVPVPVEDEAPGAAMTG